MNLKTVVLWVPVFAGLILISCSDKKKDDKKNLPVCEATDTQGCPCIGTLPDGWQACVEDGTRWGECICDTSAQDTATDTNVPPVDTASDSDTDSATGSPDTGTDTDSQTPIDTDTGTGVDTATVDDTGTGTDTTDIPDTVDTDTPEDTDTPVDTDTPQDTDTPEDTDTNPTCIQLDRVSRSVYAPAAVRVMFRLLDCDGYPVRQLTEDDVSIINNNTGVDFNLSSEGGGASAPDIPADYGFYTVLALDMSDSIFANGAKDEVIAGARDFIKRMVTDAPPETRQKVAILVFGRTNATVVVQKFTDDSALLNVGLDKLMTSSSLGTTNLYGAYEMALDEVLSAGVGLELVERSVVILTDGTHEAGDEANLREQALDAKAAAEANGNVTIFSIGIAGNYDENKLRELASRDEYFVSASDTDKISETFNTIANEVSAIAHSNYVVGVCTPVELGNASLTVKVRIGDAADSVTVGYATDILTGNLQSCSPEEVASPCLNLNCGPGAIIGFDCGGCANATDWCNDGECVDDCGTLECGESPNGLDCGACDGATDWCNAGTCVDDCGTLQCGDSPNGLDCGTCPGTDDWCDGGVCVDDCLNLQCGPSPVLGNDCGPCSGDTPYCVSNSCVAISMPAPLVYFSFNSADIPVSDDTGNGYDGTLIDAPVYLPSGGYDGSGAYEFVDRTSYITLGNTTDLQEKALVGTDGYAIAAWVYPKNTVTTQNYRILNRELGYVLYYTLGDWEFWTYDTQSTGDGNEWNEIYVSASSVNPYGTNGYWTHLVGVVDGTSMYLYVNGELEAEKHGISPLANNDLSNPTTISTPSSIYGFTGIVDEVYFFDKPLTADEVYGLYSK